MAKITYANKVTLNPQPSVANENKVTDNDMNEIKTVINTNDDNVGDLSNLATNTKSSIVGAINELKNWTKINEVTGNTVINLPSTWNELYVMFWNKDSTGVGRKFILNINKDTDIDTATAIPSYCTGMSLLSSVYFGCSCTLNKSSNTIQMTESYSSGVNVISTSKMAVWYR